MKYTKVRSFGVNAVGDIIPLDRDSCGELIDFTLSLANDTTIQNHLLGILGESEVSLDFINKFIQLKRDEDDSYAKEMKKKAKAKAKANANANANSVANTLSSIPPSSGSSKKTGSVPAWSTTVAPVKAPQSKGRLSQNTESKTTSELLDAKPSSQAQRGQAKRSKKKIMSNLNDIDGALNDLDLESTDLSASSHVARFCDCMATRHPLFEVAPNCINCGKIICIKEGLQPCSSCGAELLSAKDKLAIKNVLLVERDELVSKQENLKNKSSSGSGQRETEPKKSKPKKITISTASGGNFWDAQTKALEKAEEERKKQQQEIEQLQKEKEQLAEQAEELKHYEQIKNVDSDLLKAQERLNTLLEFQATGAERTKIIDRASDFEMPTLSNSSMWLSPVERALQLKKQQKQLRKQETTIAARTGRSKKVVEMVIKDGKVTMVENDRFSKSDDEDEDAEIKQLEDEIKKHKITHEQSLSENVWDYENDKNKWEKPVYISSGGTTSKPESQDAIIKSRIQFPTTEDSIDLVAALPS
jgi:hypothetical protein